MKRRLFADRRAPCREPQRLVGDGDGRHRNWSAVHQPFRVVLRNHVAKEGADPVEGELAFVLGENLPARIDEHQRRPGANRVALPDGKVGVVDDRMGQVVPQHGGPQILGAFLGRELGGVDADHDEFGSKFVFELPQLREDVQAVDSAVGPEVEHDEFPAQPLDRQRFAVDPLEPFRELRCSYSPSKAIRHLHHSFLEGRCPHKDRDPVPAVA